MKNLTIFGDSAMIIVVDGARILFVQYLAKRRCMLSPDFHLFYANWLRKADQYRCDELVDSFDCFFTLFVVYNRLYAEATFHLAREGKVNLARRSSFPDGAAATDYVLQFLGSSHLIDELERDQCSPQAIADIIELLQGPMPNGQRFAVRLDMVYGRPQPEMDAALLRKLSSNNRNDRGSGVLEFLYAVRCNLFHGHKGFEPVQIEVIGPANKLLRCIVEILFERLNAIQPSN